MRVMCRLLRLLFEGLRHGCRWLGGAIRHYRLKPQC